MMPFALLKRSRACIESTMQYPEEKEATRATQMLVFWSGSRTHYLYPLTAQKAGLLVGSK